MEKQRVRNINFVTLDRAALLIPEHLFRYICIKTTFHLFPHLFEDRLFIFEDVHMRCASKKLINPLDVHRRIINDRSSISVGLTSVLK